MVSRLAPVDFLTVEGSKSDPIPKIEVCRCRTGEHSALSYDPRIIVVTCDTPRTNRPQLNLDEVAVIVGSIAAYFNPRHLA